MEFPPVQRFGDSPYLADWLHSLYFSDLPQAPEPPPLPIQSLSVVSATWRS